MLVCLDEWGQVRDLYFPWVGLENHVGEGLMHRIGVYVGGRMHWLSDGAFTISITYEPETLVSRIVATSDTLGLELRSADVVYNEHDIFVRHLEVVNRRGEDREIKLFFNQQFHISESERGDTGYYSPELRALVHYKGRRVFVVSAMADGEYFTEYSVGLLGIEGKQGTWCDAEDGTLSKNPIEHGSVDSVLGLSLFMRAGATHTVSYWIAAARTYRIAAHYHRDILTRGPEHLRRTTGDFWRAWIKRTDVVTCGVDPAFLDLYQRSLFVLRTHTDNRGAIIASGDSSILQSGRDTYSYCWPRDASYIVMALVRAGNAAASEGFHTFCLDALTDEGYLLHKYRPDRSLGSSWHPWVRNGVAQPPIQEDETAITLLSLGEHYAESRDIEYIEKLYNPYVKRVADFLTRYRDRATGLPLPSHDLWEERLGVFTYTAAAVYAGLQTAARFAKLLGKEVSSKRWGSAAEEVRAGILARLCTADGTVLKSLMPGHDGYEQDATVDASSFYGLFRFGVLPVQDERLVRAYERAKEHLAASRGGWGIARYEGDQYFRTSPTGPGNPWVITTLWVAEYEIARATRAEELTDAFARLTWVRDHANGAGLLAEEYDPLTGRPTSASPLAWSHAQYVVAFLAYVAKLRELGLCPGEPLSGKGK